MSNINATVNMNSTRLVNEQIALVMTGKTPAEAYVEVLARKQVEIQLASVKAQVKAQIFSVNVENGIETLASAELIEAVETDYRRKRMTGKGALMASFVAMKVARAWLKNGFEYGKCYASNATINALKVTYNIV